MCLKMDQFLRCKNGPKIIMCNERFLIDCVRVLYSTGKRFRAAVNKRAASEIRLVFLAVSERSSAGKDQRKKVFWDPIMCKSDEKTIYERAQAPFAKMSI